MQRGLSLYALGAVLLMAALPAAHAKEAVPDRSVISAANTASNESASARKDQAGQTVVTGAENADKTAAPAAAVPAPAASSAEERQRQLEQREHEEKLKKIADEQLKANEIRKHAEESRKVEREMQEKLRREKVAALKFAQMERVREAARRQYALERHCTIRPVMSDEEIAVCKRVWR